MKLYELILRKIGWWPKDPPLEAKVYNPVSEKADKPCKVGSAVSIDNLDYRKLQFVVKEIRENSVSMGGGLNKFTDYALQARNGSGGDVWVRLRLIPDPDTTTRLSHRAIVLSLYDEMAYNEGLHGVVKDESGKFVVDDKDVHDEFWRVNDVKMSYTSDVTSMKDENNDGRIDPNEVKHEQVEFWDFSRMTTIEGVEVEQFVFVEMNKENGWFQIWRGTDINPESVSVY
jgi:hypothetical protein